METKPIWSDIFSQFDIVNARLVSLDERIGLRFDGLELRLDKVEARLASVEGRLDKVEIRLGKVEYELYGLGKKFCVLNSENLDVQNANEDWTNV